MPEKKHYTLAVMSSVTLSDSSPDLLQLRLLEARILFLQKIITFLGNSIIPLFTGSHLHQSAVWILIPTLPAPSACREGKHWLFSRAANVISLPSTRSALAGLVAAIIITEQCNAMPIQQACASSAIDLLKAACSLTTLATVSIMAYQLALSLRRDATKALLAVRHVRRKQRAATSGSGELGGGSFTGGGSGELASSDSAGGRGGAPPAGGFVGRLWAAARSARVRRLWSLAYIAVNCVHAPPGLSMTVEMGMLGMSVT